MRFTDEEIASLFSQPGPLDLQDAGKKWQRK